MSHLYTDAILTSCNSDEAWTRILERPTGRCPAWCTVCATCSAAPGRVAHRAAMWELPDRVEVCVMQIVSDDPTDSSAQRPTLYFWSAEDVEISDDECRDMAEAIRRAGEVLCAVNSA